MVPPGSIEDDEFDLRLRSRSETQPQTAPLMTKEFAGEISLP